MSTDNTQSADGPPLAGRTGSAWRNAWSAKNNGRPEGIDPNDFRLGWEAGIHAAAAECTAYAHSSTNVYRRNVSYACKRRIEALSPNEARSATEGRRVPGLLPVDQWVKAARSDEFYDAMVKGCFVDAEDLARFLLKANAGLHEMLRQLQSPNAEIMNGRSDSQDETAG